ncbi:hypothetical protein LTR17_021970 [Elasticomyces elasticus]|nr:hypothetical protein LTR17_021970 [Elasticomyces elasticus]
MIVSQACCFAARTSYRLTPSASSLAWHVDTVAAGSWVIRAQQGIWNRALSSKLPAPRPYESIIPAAPPDKFGRIYTKKRSHPKADAAAWSVVHGDVVTNASRIGPSSDTVAALKERLHNGVSHPADELSNAITSNLVSNEVLHLCIGAYWRLLADIKTRRLAAHVLLYLWDHEDQWTEFVVRDAEAQSWLGYIAKGEELQELMLK